MDWVLIPASGILLLTAATALVGAGLVWRRGGGANGPILSLLMFAAALYALSAGLEVGSVALSWKLFWSTLSYVGSGSVTTLLFLFAVRYTGHVRWLRGWRRFGIWIPPLLSVLAVTTNEVHHLIWTGFAPGPPDSNLIVYLHGPGFYVAVGIMFIYVFAASSLLIRAAVRPGVIRRRQVVCVLLGTLFPVIAGLLYVLDIPLLRGFDFVPVSVFFSSATLIASTGAFGVFDVTPVARDVLIEKMPDAVIVLDSQRRIVDLNPAAQLLFSLDSSSVGLPARDIFPLWHRLEPEICSGKETHLELALGSDPLHYAHVLVSPLLSVREAEPAGCLIVFRDISEKHGTEISLQEANRRLADQVERIERLQGELREQAIRDSLTGLFNRRYLSEVLPREMQRASRDERLLCVILFDIDRFKERNDLHGHEEGDRLLAALGGVFRDHTRPGDVACRYGGEEFLLVLPGVEPSIARERAEEIRSLFATLSLRAAGKSVVTLSAGIAVFPWHGATQDELVRAADRALYRAKATGRDRTCLAPRSDSAMPEQIPLLDDRRQGPADGPCEVS